MARVSDKRFWSDQSGAVAATYALALIPIIAMVGLAFDYARLVGMDSELQSAADQAALAGATQLDRDAGAMQRAISAIQGGLVTNETRLSNGESGRLLTFSDVEVVFYSSRADAEAGTNGFTINDNGNAGTSDANAGFVEVLVDPRSVDYAFTPIVGALTSGDIAARAVAGLGSAVCRIPPLMICNPDEPESPIGETVFDVTNRIGIGLLAKPGGGGSWKPGNYGYLDIGANGAVGVRQALGWDGPPGECLSVDGVDQIEVETQTGNIASGPAAINTRFDIYEANGCVGGDANCSPAFNVRKDLMRPANSPGSSSTCAISGGDWVEPTNAYHPTAVGPYTDPIDSMGHPRDICHAVHDDVTTADGSCKDSAFGDGNWDRSAYFKTHYGESFPWTTTSGLGSDVTRYETYLYEITNQASALADTPAGAVDFDLTTRNKAVCGTSSTTLDRRVISVAVINCNFHDVRGNTPNLPVQTWIDVFLVQPSYSRGSGGKFTKQDEIYVEIIKETVVSASGNTGAPLIRRDMPYLVR